MERKSITLHKLAEKIGARIIYEGTFSNREILRFYAGNKMSDLLNEASETTLIVTSLSNPQLIRFAELMDVPGICLVNNVVPDEELLDAVSGHSTTFIVSPCNMNETCNRLQHCLAGDLLHS